MCGITCVSRSIRKRLKFELLWYKNLISTHAQVHTDYNLQNGRILTTNFVDQNVRDLRIPAELLESIYLGREAVDYLPRNRK